MDLRETLERPVSDFSSPSFAKVSFGESVAQAARLMQGAASTEVVVTKDSKPLGIVTERDIVYRVVAAGLDPKSTRVEDIMSTPVETIEETSKVGEAVAKMSKLGVRRLVVTRKGTVVGMATQKRLVSGTLEQHVGLPELATPKGIACPYCGATMQDSKELSKHIDQVHLGKGLLQGDTSKW